MLQTKLPLWFIFLWSWCNAQPGLKLHHTVEKINERVNTPQYDEMNPVISIDGRSLYFTRVGSPDFCRTIWIDGRDVADDYSLRDYEYHLGYIYGEIEGKTGAVSNPFRSSFNQDIWFAESVHGVFDRVLHPDTPLNNALPNSICSLTPDPNIFVVVNQFSREGGMNKGFSLVRRNITEADDWNNWSFPQPIQIDNYEIVGKAVGLTMSSDGKVLILSLPADDSHGDNDLYISFKTGENQWSAPKNMGNVLNSVGREVTPHLSADGNYLYFASNRPGSQGLDLYFSMRLEEGWDKWGTPRRFVSPINSSSDESHASFNLATGYMYFSSKREGSSDIYRVKIADAVPQSFILRGRVVHSQTQALTDARVMYGNAEKGYEWHVDSENGYFKLKMEQGQKMKMTTYKAGFINHEIELQFDKNTYFNDNQEITLYVDSLAIGSSITIDPIYFERSKPYIKKNSFEVLDKLADIMHTYKNMHIRVEGHTDNQGRAEDLQKLSDDRAKEVRRYLVRSRRVDPRRVDAIGFGATKPVNDNSSELSRRMNRRVEFKITKVD